MAERNISVTQLKEHWESLEKAQDGEIIIRSYSTWHMPAWEQLCSELDWQLYPLDRGYFSKQHHGYCGVYRLIGLTSEDPLKPASISRTCREDRTGTLYLGETGWLNERLNQLRRSLHGEDTHGASRMWRECELLQSKFPSTRLAVGFLFTGVRTHGVIERDLMRAYLNSFGDTPPLNCSF